jgi:hypothetical protein
MRRRFHHAAKPAAARRTSRVAWIAEPDATRADESLGADRDRDVGQLSGSLALRRTARQEGALRIRRALQRPSAASKPQPAATQPRPSHLDPERRPNQAPEDPWRRHKPVPPRSLTPRETSGQPPTASSGTVHAPAGRDDLAGDASAAAADGALVLRADHRVGLARRPGAQPGDQRRHPEEARLLPKFLDDRDAAKFMTAARSSRDPRDRLVAGAAGLHRGARR